MANNKENYGIVYLLTNECMPGLVKIGMTSRNEMDERLRELYTTGVPMPFECVYACKVNCFKELEQALHQAFAPNRVNPSREFFRISPSQVIGLLRLFNQGDMTSEVIEEMDNDLEIEEAAQVRQPHRSPLHFYDMGLSEGTELVFAHDKTKKCYVSDARHVKYDGSDVAISTLTSTLLHRKNPHTNPGSHWLVGERYLSDIYNDWQDKLLHEEQEEA